MYAQGSLLEPEQNSRSRFEVAEIFRRFGADYQKRYALSPEQQRVMHDIEACRTAAKGGHLEACDACDFFRPVYNSCNNRHCPKCQALAQKRWLDERMERVLPTRYFHVVFTLPAELRAVALSNRECLYQMLFDTASKTLLTLCADKKRLGALPAITAVLHTWTRDLSFHPHLHCIVTGGGLTKDGSRWVTLRGNGDFLLPAKVLSRMLRGKFLAALKKAYENGELSFTGSCAELEDRQTFQSLINALYQKEWGVYAKQPFGGAAQVYAYLGRYTHRVGLSNHRLLEVSPDGIRFATRDGKSATLAPVEFIRRFLLHVLPSGFKKIRHYGLSAPIHVNTLLAAALELLASEERATADTPTSESHATGAVERVPAWMELLVRLTSCNLKRCPKCGYGTLELLPLPEDPPPS